MPQTPVGADFDQMPDIHRGFISQIAFHLTFVFNDSPDSGNLIVGQVLYFPGWGHIGPMKDRKRAAAADSENIGQPDFYVLGVRQIHADDSCH